MILSHVYVWSLEIFFFFFEGRSLETWKNRKNKKTARRPSSPSSFRLHGARNRGTKKGWLLQQTAVSCSTDPKTNHRLEESCFWCVVNWRGFSISRLTTYLRCVLVLQNTTVWPSSCDYGVSSWNWSYPESMWLVKMSCPFLTNWLAVAHSATVFFASIAFASLYVLNLPYDFVSSMEDLRRWRITWRKHMDRPSRAFWHQPQCYPKDNRTEHTKIWQWP